MLEIELDISGWNERVEGMQAFVRESLSLFLDEAMPELESYVRDNNERVWMTRGTNIGGNWGDLTLFDTGNLKRSMTSVNLLRVGDQLFWKSDMDYAEFVDEKYTIYGADPTLLQNITTRWKDWFEEQITRL